MPKCIRTPAFVPSTLVILLLVGVPGVLALDGEPSRVTDGLVVLYDFAGGTGNTVPDVSGVGTALDLQINDPGAVTWLPGGGLTLDTATIVRTPGPATKVIDAAVSTSEITVEAWLASASTAQNGPARIVTCSTDLSNRNFMLGQGVFGSSDDQYTMRLRTTATNNNGQPATSTDGGSLTTNLTHVVYTRNPAGLVTIYLDGQLARSGYIGGTMTNWDPNYALALGNELTEDRPWLGTYYLVAVFDRALSPSEIGQNYTMGPQGQPLPLAPAITTAPVIAGALNQPYVYDVDASGFPFPTFALVEGPTGMTLDAATGVINWTPGALGDHAVEVMATNSEGSDNQAFTVSVYPDNSVQIQIWHGLNQRVGHLGPGQADFNVLGNVSPVGDVASLTYSLNGGLFQDLTIGPDGIRLENVGDFNADIPVSLLQAGLNTVTIRALGNLGQVSTVDVNVTRETGSYQLPVNIDWNGVANPQDVGQYVDGLWQLQGDALRVQQHGYDRIFLIGDETWQDYEVLVPITINGVFPGGAGLGILMRFTGHIIGGHRDWPVAQPKWGYQPFGGIGWLRWTSGPANDPTMQFYYGDFDATENFGNPAKALPVPGAIPFGEAEMTKSFGKVTAALGSQYWMRMRCETQPDAPDGDGVTLYSWKIWENSASEPGPWTWQVTQESQYALRQGGVVLLAHHVDATFGDVQVTAIGDGGITGVTDLTATQDFSGNAPGNVTRVDLSWTPSVHPDAVSVSVYRKGHEGDYPEYVGDLGPDLPLDPLAEGWELVDTVPVGTNVATDLPATRDWWYYCAQVNDSGSQKSSAVMTTGALNYLLGDVSDGGIPVFDGDNQVDIADITKLASHYATAEGDGSGLFLNFVDFGPTHDMSVTGRPTCDNTINFEDLIIMSINFNQDVTAPSPPVLVTEAPPPADRNALSLYVPVLPGMGETFAVDLIMVADGQVQGLQIPLSWDQNTLEFVDFQGGPLLADQGGQSLVLSPDEGTVDIALAGVRERGLSGVGTLVQATFRVIGGGSAGFQIGDITARDSANQSVPVDLGSVTGVPGENVTPRVSALHPNFPNPFNPLTTISFDLAARAQVRLSIYSVDGRLVHTLAEGVMPAGSHSVNWNARRHPSGVYFYRLETPNFKATKKMIMLK